MPMPGGQLPTTILGGPDGAFNIGKFLRADPSGRAFWSDIAFFGSPDIGVRVNGDVALSNSFTVPTGGSLVAIPFSVVRKDTDTMFNLGNPTRLTFNTPGVYLLTNHMAVAAFASTGGNIFCGIRLNGFNRIAQGPHKKLTATDNEMFFLTSTVWNMNVGDYIETYIINQTDVPLTIFASYPLSVETQHSWEFLAQKMG